jgi:hypothetical protein
MNTMLSAHFLGSISLMSLKDNATLLYASETQRTMQSFLYSMSLALCVSTSIHITSNTQKDKKFNGPED